ncbi:GNAT family N-acetyltransferase [Massilia yuzhufengensis]|uniref:Protein N-acetyltransferase, RimJ/RimL family n=1 Tax=Massilia yuzhufengensis TaxID=1164594 RepID=A0A1I1Q7U5_9BURK|nr:GNAT family protein [Massilia yuzhufengensis]SFD18184.1 Protein N-acetyltransferase, RimJ/RimL family [Massilia yuzhufengensis]
MIRVLPVTLEFNGLRLEPLAPHHEEGLRAAAMDGELWKLRVTSVPEPHAAGQYIETALEMRDRLAFAVVDARSATLLGSTSYHDIVPGVDRVEIGYTWYAAHAQRSHVNTSCKLLLLSHAFDTLGCAVVGLRTDCENFASQAAIERLGAHKDGTIRHHALRRDGSVRDTVMYSILRAEWPAIKSALHERLERHVRS